MFQGTAWGPPGRSPANVGPCYSSRQPRMRATDAELPRVTFYLFAYNQEATVREACVAALAQDYQNLQVVFSDDCSRDGTYATMGEVASGYRGPHAILLNRNPTNLGLIGHVNRSAELATGELIVAAAGDDVSVPDRTRRLVDAYLASGRRANSIHSDVTPIDAAGRVLGAGEILERFSLVHSWRREAPLLSTINEAGLPNEVDALALRFFLVIGASHAWTRHTFEVFGPITSPAAYEDLVIAFRSLLLGPVAYVDQPLVRYRVGGGMSTSPRGHLGWRSTGGYYGRMRLATLTQRLADYERIGRPAPRALRRRIEYESLRLDFLAGKLGRVARGVCGHPWVAKEAAGTLARKVWGSLVHAGKRGIRLGLQRSGPSEPDRGTAGESPDAQDRCDAQYEQIEKPP
jgi:glycosyltransferase involved in cell wall biosynthesis